MIVRVLMLLVSFLVLVNLFIITLCLLTGENLYKKYGNQMLMTFGIFVFFIMAMYVALALIGL